jgi:hypothetical protein
MTAVGYPADMLNLGLWRYCRHGSCRSADAVESRDLRHRLIKFADERMNTIGPGSGAVLCDGDFSGWPDSDGDGMFIHIVIGSTQRPK